MLEDGSHSAKSSEVDCVQRVLQGETASDEFRREIEGSVEDGELGVAGGRFGERDEVIGWK